MRKYIPAEKLIAEIERQIEEDKNNITADTKSYYGARQQVRSKILHIITSLQQAPPALPGIEEPGIPGKDFIPVEWVDACEMYGKWKIVKQEQSEVDLDKEIEMYISSKGLLDYAFLVPSIARHFAEWGAIHLKAMKQ